MIGCKDQESIQTSTTPGPDFVEISLTVINNIVTSRSTNRWKGENINVRVKVIVQDSSSECALQMYVYS